MEDLYSLGHTYIMIGTSTIDPGMEIKEACAAGECAKYKARYEECNERVSGKSKTTETCMEEVLDFYHCIDHCNASKVFDKLK